MNFDFHNYQGHKVPWPHSPYGRNTRDICGARIDVPDMRRALHRGALGLVEHYSTSAANAPPSGYSPDFQFAVAVFGAMQWQVGDNISFVDANAGLFVRAGEEFSEAHPVPGIGHSSLIITPSDVLLDELASETRDKVDQIFVSDTRPASSLAQICAHHLVSRGSSMTGLEIEEMSIKFIRELVVAENPRPANVTKRIIDRAKAILQQLDCEPLTLSEIAAEIGVTPVYLTQAFKKWEGVPLYRYQSRLRMSRALAELPFAESLTELALNLGFSSHSHFAAAFRAEYGITPSAFRDAARS